MHFSPIPLQVSGKLTFILKQYFFHKLMGLCTLITLASSKKHYIVLTLCELSHLIYAYKSSIIPILQMKILKLQE